MEESLNRANQPGEAGAIGVERKAYAAPRLQKYGSVVELTRGGLGSNPSPIMPKNRSLPGSTGAPRKQR